MVGNVNKNYRFTVILSYGALGSLIKVLNEEGIIVRSKAQAVQLAVSDATNIRDGEIMSNMEGYNYLKGAGYFNGGSVSKGVKLTKKAIKEPLVLTEKEQALYESMMKNPYNKQKRLEVLPNDVSSVPESFKNAGDDVGKFNGFPGDVNDGDGAGEGK